METLKTEEIIEKIKKVADIINKEQRRCIQREWIVDELGCPILKVTEYITNENIQPSTTEE